MRKAPVTIAREKAEAKIFAEYQAADALVIRCADRAYARSIQGRLSTEAMRRYDRIVMAPLRAEATRLLRIVNAS